MNVPNDEPKRCRVCGKDVSSGWFARIRHGEEWILLCSPACAMRYYDSVRPEQETRAQELAANEHPLRFLVTAICGNEVKIESNMKPAPKNSTVGFYPIAQRLSCAQS